MKIFTVPGLYNSGPQHWQTHWEKEYGFTRIEQEDPITIGWETPACTDWLQSMDTIITQHPLEDVILIAHSLACCTIVRWAQQYNRIIKGTLLAAPSDVDAPSYPPGTTGFAPMPIYRLSLSSQLLSPAVMMNMLL